MRSPMNCSWMMLRAVPMGDCTNWSCLYSPKLSNQSRKEPVIARIALLDTRFKEYQHIVIGTVLTTLHAGSVLLTFYPNFNLSLEDPNLPTTLKVQIQLQGAELTPTSKIATLHHQIMYRLQNHALDLPTPYTTSDALMIG